MTLDNKNCIYPLDYVSSTFDSGDINNAPTKPVGTLVIPEDGSSKTPIFEWLTSLDFETDQLSYEISVFASETNLQLGAAHVGGDQLPASFLSAVRNTGDLSSVAAISALSAMSAYVVSSWLEALVDGNYYVKIRAFDGETYSPWSDDLFFFVDAAPDAPILTLVPKNAKIEIYWTNPPDPDYTKTVILYSAIGYPEIESDFGYLESKLVDENESPGQQGTYVHKNLINGMRYYYTAVAYDQSGKIGIIQKSAVPIPATTVKNLQIAGRNKSNVLVWENPTSEEFPNFNHVVVGVSTFNFPSVLSDGEIIYTGSDNYFYHSGLVNGQRYYYTVWTVDGFNEPVLPGVNATMVPVIKISPVGNLIINGGDALTYSVYTKLDIIVVSDEFSANVTNMMLSNFSDFRDTSWVSIQQNKEWTLLHEEGVRYVYLKLKDEFGNVSDTIASSIDLKFDWMNELDETKSAISGVTENARYGVGIISKSDNFIGIWADGEEADVVLYKRGIKTINGDGQIIVDGKVVSKYRYYAP